MTSLFLDPRGGMSHKVEVSAKLNIIILAAGHGVRMASPLPKVLHPVAGQPMLARILKAVADIASSQIRVVVGHGAHLITPVAGKYKALCFKQDEKDWGTARAVKTARPEELEGRVLIASGDHPLISPGDLRAFIQSCYKSNADFVVAGFKHPGPNEYGRLICDGDRVKEIVEAVDVKKKGKDSSLVNAGLYLTTADVLKEHLKDIGRNEKGEHNLTDIVSILHQKGRTVKYIPVPWNMAFGVNSQLELSSAGKVLFEYKCDELMRQGVIIVDVKNTYIESDVRVGTGSMIYPGVYLKGQTRIGAFCAVESGSFIFDSVVKDYVNVKSGCYIEKSLVGEKSVIGPYAHLREGTEVGKECRVGNFVETKKAVLGDRSKTAHLSYLGDVTIGSEVNIGCGAVTCNYGPDKKKRKTRIGDRAFIGSGAQLVAPVEVQADSLVGAGSVITKNVPKGHIAIERSEQKNIKKK